MLSLLFATCALAQGGSPLGVTMEAAAGPPSVTRIEGVGLRSNGPLGLVLDDEHLALDRGRFVRSGQTWPATLRDATLPTTLFDVSAMGFDGHVLRFTRRDPQNRLARLSLFRVTGPASTSLGFVSPSDWVSAEEPEFHDLDGDGRPELLLLMTRPPSFVEEIAILAADGSGGFTTRYLALPNGLRAASLSAGDYDGDGRVDIAVLAADGRGGAGGRLPAILTVALQDALGTFTFGPESSAITSNDLSRVDSLSRGAGTPDTLMLTGTTDRFAVFEHRSGALVNLNTSITPGELDRPLVWDADGDGIDAVVGFDRASGSLDLRLHPENPSFNPLAVVGAERRRVPLGAGWEVDPVVADFDRDGFDDLVYPHGPGLRLIRGGPSGARAADEEVRLDGSVRGVLDWDGDGDQDLILAKSQANTGDRVALVLAINDGFGSFTEQLLPNAAAIPQGEVFALDMDGDGTRDLISREIVQLLEPATLQAGPPQRVSFDPMAEGFFHATDLDQDGRGDILVSPTAARTSGSRGLWRMGMDSNGLFRRNILVTPQINRSFLLADLDGDGLEDIAGLGDSRVGTRTVTNLVVLLQRPGAGFNTASYPVNPLVTPALAHVDFDGDGDRDLIAGDLLLVNDGQGAFSLFGPSGVGILSPPRLSALDIDGDGDEDLLSQDLKLWRNVGGPLPFALAAQSPLLPSFASASILPHQVDLDGDGDQDLITAFGARNGMMRQLDANRQPRLGSARALRITGAPAGQAQVALSLGQARADLGRLGTFLLDPTQLVVLPWVGLGATDGIAELRFAIPDVPAAAESELWAQALMADAAGTLRLSNALHLTLQAR